MMISSDSEMKSEKQTNKYGFVYMTTNNVNGKRYIGQRKYYGRYDTYLGSGRILLLAIEKYGKENFTREILEECDTKEALNEREQYWIDYYNADTSELFYNIEKGGEGGFGSGVNSPWYGRHLSLEHKARLSASKVGENNPFYRMRHTAESRAKMSASQMGKTHTDEYKKYMSEYMSTNHPDVSGENNPRARAVVQLSKDNVYLNRFPYIRAASKEIGAQEACISSCCKRKQKSAGVYVWRYEDEYKEETING